MLTHTAAMLIFLLLSYLLASSGLFAILWHRDDSKLWTPDPSTLQFLAHLNASSTLLSSLASPLITALPLHTRGRHILDAHDRRIKLASVNWYGASDALFVPSGLDIQHRDAIAHTIRRLGFNSVRLPYADELVLLNPPIPLHLLAANPDLAGQRALDVFAAVVEALTRAGLAVVVNNHITRATWCCGADPCDGLWFNDFLPAPLCRVRLSEAQWIDNWARVMAPHVGNPLVVAADLRNEVRAPWGTVGWASWAGAAERAGDALLSLRPDWLIVVGGMGSQNFLDGVRERPVRLAVPGRVVYSAHVYAWSGWGSRGGMYSKRSYAAFAESMRENWAYLLEEDIAPVWVGEFGCPHAPGEGDANYWTNLMRFLKVVDADFAYWAVNPRKPKDNAEETYSLVEDDWKTLILDYRMKDMLELMQSKA